MRDIAPFGLRIPAELKTKIEQAAAKNRRSLNAEMVTLMEKCLEHIPLADYSDGELIADLMRRYGRGEIYIRIGKTGSESSEQ